MKRCRPKCGQKCHSLVPNNKNNLAPKGYHIPMWVAHIPRPTLCGRWSTIRKSIPPHPFHKEGNASRFNLWLHSDRSPKWGFAFFAFRKTSTPLRLKLCSSSVFLGGFSCPSWEERMSFSHEKLHIILEQLFDLSRDVPSVGISR